MRLVVFSLAALAAAVFLPPAFPAHAGEASPAAATDGDPIDRLIGNREQTLDRLFAELKRTGNPKAAERIARAIQDEWSRSGSASVDLMMQWAQKAAAAGTFNVALDFLDQVVTLQPDYAEGWNRRATVHYMMKDYARSMADIDRTLKLEPRHYGALSGLARIMSETGRKQPALNAWQRVLDIYPALRSAQDQLSTLSEDMAGQAI